MDPIGQVRNNARGQESGVCSWARLTLSINKHQNINLALTLLWWADLADQDY